MNVKVLPEACIGCGACEAINNSVFELDSNGIAVAKSENITEENKDSVLDAVSSCPTGAIEIIEE